MKSGLISLKYFIGHDDRTSSRPNEFGHMPKLGHTKLRVSFKNQNFKSDKIKSHLLKHQIDDDVLMSGSNNNSRQFANRGRGKRFPRGRNSPLPSTNIRDGRSRTIPISESNWYRVNVRDHI